MAKAALETAVLDAELRARRMSFATYLGAVRDRIPAGVSVGIPGSLAELIGQVEGYLEQGYRRVKLKIEPGWDVEPIAAVRERFGSGLALQADANTACTSPSPPGRAPGWRCCRTCSAG
jgi:O-succinylbenzoate synthase